MLFVTYGGAIVDGVCGGENIEGGGEVFKPSIAASTLVNLPLTSVCLH